MSRDRSALRRNPEIQRETLITAVGWFLRILPKAISGQIHYYLRLNEVDQAATDFQRRRCEISLHEREQDLALIENCGNPHGASFRARASRYSSGSHTACSKYRSSGGSVQGSTREEIEPFVLWQFEPEFSVWTGKPDLNLPGIRTDVEDIQIPKPGIVPDPSASFAP